MRLAERNQDQPNRNGLFASHPETKERISRIAQTAKATKTAALVQPRYKAAIPYQPTAMTAISVVEDGAAGLTGSGSSGASAEEKKAAEKKQEPRRGLGLGALRTTVGQEKQSTQVSASGGARGVEPDRGAKGGDNPALVRVSVSQTELDAFRKGIA
jgi:hypothetical protein